MAKIAIYGTGYVGLVTGVCFAESGHKVVCVDVDKDKVEELQQGKISILEENLPELLIKNQKNGKITFTSHMEEAIQQSNYHFIAVGTPEGQNGEADLTFVNAAASEITRLSEEPFVILLKSTVPVGTAKKLRKKLINEQETRNQQLDFHVVSNPEFLREGKAIYDCLNPDRIILGGEDEQFLTQLANEIYAHHIEKKCQILTMTSESAELTKYAANGLLAMKISFMNELSQLAEKTEADIDRVREGISVDSRIGPHFIHAGCGYGGSCFPKDVNALIAMFEKNNCDANLLKQVPDVNQRQMEYFCGKILRYFSDAKYVLSDITIALWGLSFKPGTDDIRESPAIYISNRLSKEGITIQAYDPASMRHVTNFSWLQCATSAESALKGADALVIATAWSEFEAFDRNRIVELLKTPIIFDARNIYDRAEMTSWPFDYISVGRSDVLKYGQKGPQE